MRVRRTVCQARHGAVAWRSSAVPTPTPPSLRAMCNRGECGFDFLKQLKNNGGLGMMLFIPESWRAGRQVKKTGDSSNQGKSVRETLRLDPEVPIIEVGS